MRDIRILSDGTTVNYGDQTSVNVGMCERCKPYSDCACRPYLERCGEHEPLDIDWKFVHHKKRKKGSVCP